MSDLAPAAPPQPATTSQSTANAEAAKTATSKTAEGPAADPPKLDAEKDGPKPRVDRDPILDLVQKLQGAAIFLSDRDAGLATGINRLAERSADPGAASEALFRTQVAYSLQDMEKVVGAGRIAMPAELRTEMSQLSATAPGLDNRQMETLVRSTPDIDDRALVRDVRRAATIIGGLGADQNSAGVREQVDVLENRVRLAARAAAPEPATGRPDQVKPAITPPEPHEAAQNAKSSGITVQTRAQASPGDASKNSPTSPIPTRKADNLPSASEQQPPRSQPKSALTHILDGMRSPTAASPPPWNPPPIRMADRITNFEHQLNQGKTDQLIRASEKSGVAYMKAIETFAAGPGAGVLGKIDAAAITEPGGVKAVMSEMKPGGRYANLRSEFDDALQKDRVFAASYSQVERTGSQFGRDRLALAGDFEAKKLNVSQIDGRFQKADEAIGEATSKIPGRTPGKSVMEELGEKVAELLSKAVDRVRAMFGRDAVPDPRPTSSPTMAP